MLAIQSIDKESVEEVYNLGKICFGEDTFNRNGIFQMMENERYHFWGIWKGENLAGYVILLDSIDIFEVIKIGVDKSFRRQGIGEALLNGIFDFTSKDIHLEVRENNFPAIKLYHKMGFKNLHRRKKYYGDTGEDAIVMVFNI